MKAFKQVFIILFPLMLFACIVTHLTNHITLRQTYYFILDTFSSDTTKLVDNLRETSNSLKSLSFTLPTNEELENNNFLQNIWTYIKWFVKVITNLFIYALSPLRYTFNIIVWVIDVLLSLFKILFFFIGI